MEINTPFEFFWQTCNDMLQALGKPILGHDEARDAWRNHRTAENDKAFIRVIPIRKVRAGDKPAWRGEYRFIGGDWRVVTNDHGLTIRYMSPDYALDAARHARKTFIG